MTPIYHVYSDEYEAEGFYNSDGKLLTLWSMNDAHWRSEYMNPLLEKLGFKVEQAHTELNEAFETKTKELWG